MNQYVLPQIRPKNKLSALDYTFAFWLVTELLFLHTTIAQLGLLCFVGATAFDMAIVRRKLHFSYLYVFYGLFLLIAYLNVGLGYSIDTATSNAILRTLLINAVFIVAAYNYLTRTPFLRIKKLLILCAVVGSVGLIVMNVFQNGSLFFRGTDDVINGNSVAMFDAYVMAVIICSRQRIRARDIGVLAFLALFCVLAATRKALLILGIAVVLYYCFKYPTKLPKYVILFSVIGLAAYWLLMNVPFLYNSIGNRMESFIEFLQGAEGDGSTQSRYQYIELGLKSFKEHPIWGIGIDCFRELDGAYGTYSHNNFIELLVGVGLLGTISYYLIHLISLIKSIVQYSLHRYSLACLSFAFMVAYLVTDYATVSYFDRPCLIIVVLCIALISNKRVDHDEQIETAV